MIFCGCFVCLGFGGGLMIMGFIELSGLIICGLAM